MIYYIIDSLKIFILKAYTNCLSSGILKDFRTKLVFSIFIVKSNICYVYRFSNFQCLIQAAAIMLIWNAKSTFINHSICYCTIYHLNFSVYHSNRTIYHLNCTIYRSELQIELIFCFTIFLLSLITLSSVQYNLQTIRSF